MEPPEPLPRLAEELSPPSALSSPPVIFNERQRIKIDPPPCPPMRLPTIPPPDPLVRLKLATSALFKMEKEMS
jgi:hypothetical protein